jgi:hypothetical protein
MRFVADRKAAASRRTPKEALLRRVSASRTGFLKYIGALPDFSSIREANEWVGALRDEES